MENSSASEPETSVVDGVRDRRKLSGIGVDMHVDEFTAVELQGLKLVFMVGVPRSRSDETKRLRYGQ